MAKKQATLKNLNTQMTQLQVEVDAATRESALLKKTINEAEDKQNTQQQELQKLNAESETRQNELNDINIKLTELSKKNITPHLVTRIHKLEVETGDALLERVATASAYVEVKRNLAKLNSEKQIRSKELTNLQNMKHHLASEIRSQQNILDEAQRRNQAFANAIEVVESFFADGYVTMDLQRIRDAIKIIQIKGKPKLSINRLVSGLEGAETLTKLTNQIAEKRKELEVLKSEISTAKGELTAFRDDVLKVLNKAKANGIRVIANTAKSATSEISNFKKTTQEALTEISSSASAEITSISDETTKSLQKVEGKASEIARVLDEKTANSVLQLNRDITSITKEFKDDFHRWNNLADEVRGYEKLMMYGYILLGLEEDPKKVVELPLPIIAKLSHWIHLYVQVKIADAITNPSKNITELDHNIRTRMHYESPPGYRLEAVALWLKEELERRVAESVKNA